MTHRNFVEFASRFKGIHRGTTVELLLCMTTTTKGGGRFLKMDEFPRYLKHYKALYIHVTNPYIPKTMTEIEMVMPGGMWFAKNILDWDTSERDWKDGSFTVDTFASNKF